MHRLIVVIPLLFLTACATTAKYDQQLNGWIGKQDIDLVRVWGAPHRTYEAGGHKFLTYASSSIVSTSAIEPTYVGTRSGSTRVLTPVGGSPAHAHSVSCTTTFELEGTRIIAWSHKGDDCRSSR